MNYDFNNLNVGDTITCLDDYDRKQWQKSLKANGIITICDNNVKNRIEVVEVKENCRNERKGSENNS